MEEVARVPVDQWDDYIASMRDIEPHQIHLVKECAEQVRDLFQMGLPTHGKRDPQEHYQISDRIPDTRNVSGIFAEVSVDPGFCQPGTADLVVVFGNKAVLVDYKNTYVVRDHQGQALAYVIGLLRALPQVQFVEVRIVTPRLGEVHAPETYEREVVLSAVLKELEAIVAESLDPFTPGRPCASCAMCAGNGRCPWQMASLRDVPVELSSLMLPNVWQAMMTAATPELRSQRLMLAKWLEAYTDAVKEDNKKWAIENPDVVLPGFTKTVGLGRATLDKDRLAEANQAIMETFGLKAEDLLGFCVPDKARIAEYLSMISGTTQKESEVDVGRALAPFTTRGADIISFRAEKKAKAIK